jgi:hypothetical protein
MLQPVVQGMATRVRQSKALHTDATQMPYLDPAVKGQSLSGQMWTYCQGWSVNHIKMIIPGATGRKTRLASRLAQHHGIANIA